MRDLPSLTGLRGVAALWVLSFHVIKICGGVGAGWAAHASVLGFGWTGVDLFFVLSGFILMWTHGAAFAQPTLAKLRRFALGLVLRVYPLSLIVLCLITVLVVADPLYGPWYRDQDAGNLSAGALVRTALLATRWISGAQGEWNEPTWSLSAEVVGYAAFPLLAWLIVRCNARTAVAIAAASLATLAAFEILTGLAGSNPIDQIPALMRMACAMIAGMAACRSRQSGSRPAGAGSGLGAIAVLLALALAFRVKDGGLAAPAAFTAIIYFLSLGGGVIDRALSSAPALILGRISFPLYLIHLTPLLWLSRRVDFGALSGLDTAVLLFGYVAFCLGAAGVLHIAVEQPLHAWSRRQAAALPARTPPNAAGAARALP